MAELLIRIKDKEYSSAKEFFGQFHAGDVIAAKTDGWEWSDRERENPQWIILRVPFTISETEALNSRELNWAGTKRETFNRQRKFDLKDLDWMLDKNHTDVVTPTEEQVKDLRKAVTHKGNADEVIVDGD